MLVASVCEVQVTQGTFMKSHVCCGRLCQIRPWLLVSAARSLPANALCEAWRLQAWRVEAMSHLVLTPSRCRTALVTSIHMSN